MPVAYGAGWIAAGLLLVCLVLWGLRWRVGFWPWRQVVLWGYQVTCWARGHQWNEREVDLTHTVPGFRKPYLWLCGRCGAAAMREWTE